MRDACPNVNDVAGGERVNFAGREVRGVLSPYVAFAMQRPAKRDQAGGRVPPQVSLSVVVILHRMLVPVGALVLSLGSESAVSAAATCESLAGLKLQEHYHDACAIGGHRRV